MQAVWPLPGPFAFMVSVPPPACWPLKNQGSHRPHPPDKFDLSLELSAAKKQTLLSVAVTHIQGNWFQGGKNQSWLLRLWSKTCFFGPVVRYGIEWGPSGTDLPGHCAQRGIRVTPAGSSAPEMSN